MAEAIAVSLEALFFSGEMVFTATQVAAIGSAAMVVGSVALANAQKSRQMRAARDAFNASLKDREITVRSAVAPRRIVYGRDRVAGHVTYAQSTGDKKQFLHLVLSLAGHECDAIEKIWFNDVLLPDPDAGGYITSGEFSLEVDVHADPVTRPVVGGVAEFPDPAPGSAAPLNLISVTRLDTGELLTGYTLGPGTTEAYALSGLPSGVLVVINVSRAARANVVRVKKYLGQVGQVADADLVAESGGKWTSDHRGDGICYLYLRLEFVTDIFGQVGLPNVLVQLRGKKVRDPRTGLTVWNDNTALCVADWLRDSAFGYASSADQVPDSEVVAAANICDETVEIDAGGTTQKRYIFNGSFLSTDGRQSVLEDLLTGMAGRCVWTQGRWLVRPGAYRAPTLTINEDKLAGTDVEVITRPSRSELFNAVRATYRDPDKDWAEVQAPLVTNAGYEAQDGGRRIVRNIQLPCAMDSIRAQRMAKIELERARQAATVNLTTSLRGYNVAPTDSVTLQLGRYGWAAGKVFECITRDFAAEGFLRYAAQETAAGIYAWAHGEATVGDLAPDTDLPNPYARPETLAGLAADSGTDQLLLQADGTVVSRVKITWTPSADIFVVQGGRIDVQWRPDDVATWISEPAAPGDAGTAYVAAVPDGKVCLFRVRQVNQQGRASHWATVAHKVLGKSEAPDNVASLSAGGGAGMARITWTKAAAVDYKWTELRLGASWAAGTLLATVAGTSYAWTTAAAGTYTVWAAHVDTSGNYSATPVSAGFTVTAAVGGGGGNVTFLQDTAPTGAAAGDIWTESDNDNTEYRFDGTTWVPLLLGTAGLASRAVSDSVIQTTSTTVGSIGAPGSTVTASFFQGSGYTWEADDELDVVCTGLHAQAFYAQPASAVVDIRLYWDTTFGGQTNEITEPGTSRRHYTLGGINAAAGADVDIAIGPITWAPGAGVKYLKLVYTISYFDSSGAPFACGRSYEAQAQWRLVRRKR